MLAYVQQNAGAKPQKSMEERYAAAGIDPSAPDPTEGMGTFQKAAAGFGKSLYDTARGIGQLVGAVDETRHYFYSVRLAGFLLVLAAIADKNRTRL